jgi:HPt (histidine-containing phosphotransfer) domain-containing protein
MNETSEDKRIAAKARMAEFALKFLHRSRGDLRLMREALASVVPESAGRLGEIRHLAHRMAGTGATLGFDALGQHALGIEALIESLPNGAVPDASLLTKLSADIDTLESQLAADARAMSG